MDGYRLPPIMFTEGSQCINLWRENDSKTKDESLIKGI